MYPYLQHKGYALLRCLPKALGIFMSWHQDIFSLDATQHEAKLVVLGMLQHYFLILERSESYVQGIHNAEDIT